MSFNYPVDELMLMRGVNGLAETCLAETCLAETTKTRWENRNFYIHISHLCKRPLAIALSSTL